MKSRIFIGSSRESLDLVGAVNANLEDLFEVAIWSQGIFSPSKFILESLLDELARADFGMFIFAPDDAARIRGRDVQTVRDNVIFELGLFIGRLGRERSFFIIPRGIEDLHLPTDLLGVNAATYDPNNKNLRTSLLTACIDIKNVAIQLGPREGASKSAEAGGRMSEMDASDCISLIESWLASRPASQNTQAIKFSDVDKELGLPNGSARQHLETAARRWGYVVLRKGENTITLQEQGRA